MFMSQESLSPHTLHDRVLASNGTGKQYKAVTVSMYEDACHVSTSACGFIIDPACCWLEASSVRLVEDPTGNQPSGLLEVKCPFSACFMPLDELLESQAPSWKCMTVLFILGQMKISHLK